jgi:hypothetical protein
MYTMTVYAVGRTVIARGRSLQGECWEETLIRLHKDTLPDGEPPRRVIYMTYHAAQVGSPTNMVMLGHGDPVDGETSDPPMLIGTDPPQF